MRKYRNWILSLGIVAAPGLAVAEPAPFGNGTPSANRPAGAVDNQQVAENIARALRAAKLPGSNIDIAVSGGVATLSGQIADARSKAMASQLVSSQPGVLRVDNQLKTLESKPVSGGVQQAAFTAPPQPSANTIEQVAYTQTPVTPAANNQAMAERIGAALSSANLNGYNIKIKFSQGTATLLGSVGSPQQKAMAEQVVSNVAGVSGVNNQLQVAGATPRNPRLQQVAFQADPAGQPMTEAPMGVEGGYPAGMVPPSPYGNAVPGMNPVIYNQPYLPPYAWPAQAQYPNSAAIQYPRQYSASAWPYIGPFHPYPQVPLGWRKVTLEWDDGQWMLDFDSRTDRWFWFINPKNW